MANIKNTIKIKAKLTELFLHSSKDESDGITYSKESIASRSAVLFIASIGGIFITFLLEIIAEYLAAGFWKILLEGTAEFLENVFGLIFAASIGSLMLDFFSYIKYAQERIKEVIIDKDFLRTVNDEEKKKIISTLESSLYFKGEDIPEDSLYTNIKEKIIPLLDEEYYEKYDTHIDCEIKDGKIYKTIFNNFTIYSPRDNSVFRLPFSVYYAADDIDQIEVPHLFNNLRFNNQPVSISEQDTEMKDVNESLDIHKKSFTLKRDLTLKKGLNTVSYETKSIVDISDNVYSKTMTLPCKNCTLDFHVKTSDYSVKAYGFALDTTECVSIKYYDNICKVEFSDWVIPGDGCIFVINKKKNN